MKKIRLLALILALLMLPLSLLVACNKDDTPDDEPGTEEPGGDTTEPGGDDGGKDDEKDDVVYDKDGTASGYLMFFNFDAAQRGDLRTDTKPYKPFLTVDSKAEGVGYIITSDFAKSGNSLLIQREDSNAEAKFEINLASVSGISAMHTIEFSIKVGEGYITDDITFYGLKGTASNTFIKLTSKGITDASGNLLYEYKETDEWLDIAIGIDDAEKKYNVFVGGAKLTSDVSYTTAAYTDWETTKTTAYGFNSAKLGKDMYVHIDNLGILSGKEPVQRDPSKDEITYTDVIKDELHYYDFSDKETYFAQLESKFLGPYIKKEPYKIETYTKTWDMDPGQEVDNQTFTYNKLLLSESFAICRINNTTNKFEIITHDYGVEKGLYNYGADFGNKLFKLDDDNYFFFKSNYALEFEGKLKGVDISGKYVCCGDNDNPQAKLTFTLDEAEEIRYAKLDLAANTITVAIDEAYSVAPQVYTMDATERSAFDGKVYGYTLADSRVILVVYEAIGKADLTIETADAVTAELKGVAYTYADGVITIANGETTYSFTYTADDADGTFTYGENTFGLYDKWQVMDSEQLYTYYTGYRALGSWSYQNTNFTTTYKYGEWTKVKFKYFVPENGINYSIGFYIGCRQDIPENTTGGIVYWLKGASHDKSGWYELELDLSTMEGSKRGEHLKYINGQFQITTSGWKGSVGRVEDNKDSIPHDGYGIVIAEIKFFEDRTVVVEGPAADKLDCTHTAEDGTSLFAPAGVVDATCTTIGYSALKCSECGATKVDPNGDVVNYTGHTVSEDAIAMIIPATCTEDGYTYKLCTSCGIEVVQQTLASEGHQNTTPFYDSSENMIRITCKVCGVKSDYALIETLMTGQEKIESSAFTSFEEKFEFAVWEEHNLGKTYNSDTIAGFQFANKGNIAQTGLNENGQYYLEFKRNAEASDGKDSFFQFNPADKFGVAVDFVVEFDVMLGAKAANGQYLTTSIAAKDRNFYGLGASTGRDIQLGNINGSGVFLFYENGTAAAGETGIQLSEDEFVNIAIAVSPSNNTIAYYINGYYYKTFEARPDDISMFTLNNLRFACGTGNFANEIESKASMFYNNLMCYPSDKPICVLQDGSNIVKEFQGTIALETAPKTPAGPNVSVTDADINLSMPQYTVSTKYVLEFNLTAAALTDGAILTGVKLDEYRFENKLDILTVKGDYIYYLDTAICAVSEVADGVKLTLETNDKTGKTNVYVDGKAVPGGAIEYNASHGYYGDPDSYITGYVFGSAVGAYEVTELNMYTGVLKTETPAE